MKVRVIIDSTTDLSQAWKERMDIVPLTVHFGEEEYIDGVTITHKEFYEKLVTGDVMPSTSQATPATFEEAFRKVAEAGESAVVLTLASQLSGTYQSAVIAASDFENIYVVDTGSVTIGGGILAMRAQQLADSGMDAASIAAQLEKEKEKIRVLAVLDTLEYLKRGGRISKAVAFAGGMLNIKPLLAITDGQLSVPGKARGNKQGNSMLNQLIQKAEPDANMPVLLGYTGQSDELLQKYMEDSSQLWSADTDYTMIGSVVGTHAGPGAVAVAFFTK